ncbi:unnamed protein product [Anisakis simplex]|uniref:Uncharacterized protein n=1 Tax=Anisakis simplex TaxID=6269 RepID=A0A3P6SNE8_ANISI|nr:unnamed protein product [Anisakis simplex]
MFGAGVGGENRAFACAWYATRSNLSATHSDLLLRREMRNMYVTLLNADDKEYLNLKIQTLKNLELFLMEEESKMVKNNDEFWWTRTHASTLACDN